ncbi:MAG: hypothetical protein HFJ53_05135 [Clostridia bacterium]|nr:hypothetical protein [Clostridia bacterium]
MKKIRQEKGSITLFVLISMLFFVMFLIGMYLLNANSEITQTAATKRIKEIYEQDVNNIDNVYETINKQKKQIANPPKLTQGMIPIKWDGTKWVDTNTEDEQWYDYSQKKWANVRLKDGSMFVWIPRYAYKITSNWHEKTTGNIEIEFLKDDTNRTISENIIQISSKSAQNQWLISPSFYWDKNNNGKEDEQEGLTGIWVAKYEASKQSVTIENLGNIEVLKIQAGVSSWREITTNDMFMNCYNMNIEQNRQIYGLSSDKEVVEPHLMKNTEWGIVTYLAMSQYGINTNISPNNNTQYITGVGNSTTGNVTGVYDMSGGSNEFVAAYLNNNYAQNIIEQESVIKAELKYKDIYEIGEQDTSKINYEKNKTKYSDALYEVSTNLQPEIALWGNGYLEYPTQNKIMIYRGGTNLTQASIFTAISGEAGSNIKNSFRPVISVLK